MPVEINGKLLYSPRETADRLGINVGMLRYHRNAGNIAGVEMGTITYYSEEQIQAATLSPKKRGPRNRSADKKQPEGNSSSVILMRKTSITGITGRLPSLVGV